MWDIFVWLFHHLEQLVCYENHVHWYLTSFKAPGVSVLKIHILLKMWFYHTSLFEGLSAKNVVV